MVFEDKEPANQSAEKMAKTVKDFGKNMSQMAAAMDRNYDQGKYLVKEMLDDVYSRINKCNHLIEQIKKYPLDAEIPTLDPLYECQKAIEPALGRLEKRLTLLVLERRILESKNNAAKLEEEFQRVQKANFL